MAQERRTLAGLALLAVLTLSSCTGMGIRYGEPADKGLDNVTLVPISAESVLRDRQQQASRVEPQTRRPLTTSPRDIQNYEYRIRPADILSITVPSVVTLSQPGRNLGPVQQEEQGYVVSSDGTIYLPFSGPATVANMTLREVQQKVARSLSRYLKSPQVVVAVQEFRSQRVLLTGQVPQPGYVPITDVPLTVIGALSQAGGVAHSRGKKDVRLLSGGTTTTQSPEAADYSRVVLTRNRQRHVINVEEMLGSPDRRHDILLQDGDILHVPPMQRDHIYVLGEVVQPSLMEFAVGQTSLAQVLSASGGLNRETSNAERVYVIRGDVDAPRVYHLNAKSADAILLANAFEMQPRDVVYVSEHGISRWSRFVRQLIPSIQALLTGTVIANTVDRD